MTTPIVIAFFVNALFVAILTFPTPWVFPVEMLLFISVGAICKSIEEAK